MRIVYLLLIMLFSSITSHAGVPKRWYTEYYAENALLHQSWATKFFFQNYVFQGNETVLDIGSGKGNITAMIANYVPQGYVIGIDRAESVIKKAKQDYRYIKNLDFLLRSAEDISFYENHKGKFNVITSFSALHWIHNNDKVLQGISIALKPGGICYLRLASKGGDPVEDIADRLSKSPKWKAYFANFKTYIKRFTPAEYAALLEKNNLKITSICDLEDKDLLGNITQLKTQIKSWLPHYHHLDSMNTSVAEKFIDEIATIYISKFPPNPNGSIILYDHHLEIVAIKPTA